MTHTAISTNFPFRIDVAFKWRSSAMFAHSGCLFKSNKQLSTHIDKTQSI